MQLLSYIACLFSLFSALRHVTCETKKCGPCSHKYLNSTTGTISSPNFPNPYGHSCFCEYSITTSSNSQVGVTFTVKGLEHQGHHLTDFVVVFNGDSCAAEKIAAVYKPTGETFVTGNGKMAALFISSSPHGHEGFTANYSTVSGKSITKPKEPFPGNHILTPCGADLDVDGGGTMEFVGTGKTDTLCIWRLTASSGNRMQIRIGKFQLSNSMTWVRVLDGDSCGGRELFFRNLEGPFASDTDVFATGNAITVVLFSPSGAQGATFRLWYADAPTKCGPCSQKLVGNSTGTITSPNFPRRYGQDCFCEYSITVPDNGQVSATFTTVQLEHHGESLTDFVVLFNGDGCAAERIAAVYKPTDEPFVTSKSSMAALFISNGKGGDKGFSATYSSVSGKNVTKPKPPFPNDDILTPCGRIMQVESGGYESYDGNGKQDTLCIWNLFAPEGQHLQIRIGKFQLSDSTTWVRVLDGSSCSGTELFFRNLEGPFASDTDMVSTGNAVTVVLFSPSGAPGATFRFWYNNVSETKELESP